tara:strand:+ start:11722 stop:13638 length:1917 start_codon:yes stop_codon:yes gene_type:complete
MALPLFRPQSTWTAPKLSELPQWPTHGRVGYDLETNDPHLTKGGPGGRGLGPGVRRDGRVIGIGFAIEGGPSFYLPIGHENGQNVSPKHAWQYIRDQAKAYKGAIVGANLPYDLDYSAENGVEFQGDLLDVQVAEPLLNELHQSFSLDNIAGYHDIPGKDESLLKAAAASMGINPKSQMSQLDPKYVGGYAEQDCMLPLEILRKQEALMAEAGLMDVWRLESKLLLVLLKMRRRGVRIDFDRLDQVATWSDQMERDALSKINHIRGARLTTDDTNKSSVLGPIFREMGYEVPQTAKTGKDSVTNDWLKTLKTPVADAVLEAKKFNKLRNTFVTSILAHQTNGRIHCTFRQGVGEDASGDEGGARYGRLSCKAPNLQQQPARDPVIGPRWRSIYLPDDGGSWLKGDYSSQEPRITAHYAAESNSPGGKEMVQRYIDNPRLDYHQTIADIMNTPRKPAKAIGLGLNYGMGQGLLANSLGLPTEMKSFTKNGRKIEYLGAGPEAMALIDQYHAAVPYASNLSKRAKKKANKVGYVMTWDGRRCRFPRVMRNGKWQYDWTEKALSRIVQGTAAGQMRKAMVDADAAGHKLQLQVHDELNKTSDSHEDGREMTEIMVHAIEFRVPMVVDMEWGPSWGELEVIK